MALRTKTRIICFILLIFAISNYTLFFSKDTYWDDVMLTLFVAITTVLYITTTRDIFRPLQELANATPVVSVDPESTGTQLFNDNEINRATTALKHLSQIVKSATEGIVQIKAENIVSNGQQDHDSKGFENTSLLTELDTLRHQLKALAEQEKERKWITEGMAKFVDILKADYTDEKSFYDRIVMNLVKYMGANQGGLFLVVDENNRKYLSMEACYAFDRKKYLQKTIDIGEGLIGQTFLEQKTIYMTHIPTGYVTITSGLGNADPQSLLIVPFVLNDHVECVIELASFAEFKQYQIEFIEKLGENIAATISNMRINANTRRLLEETQTHTEEMKAQEEEMRQNMEELTATQEEMARKEKELSKLLESSNENQQELKRKIEEVEHLKEENQRETSKMLEYQEKYKQDIIGILNELPAKVFVKDSNGYMILCNKVVADSYNLPVERILGTHDKDHFDAEQAKEWAAQEAEIIKEGGRTFVQEERLHDKLRYLKTTKMPFYIRHLDQLGLLGFQIDVTDSYKAAKIGEKA